jgi:hypothetical protein
MLDEVVDETIESTEEINQKTKEDARESYVYAYLPITILPTETSLSYENANYMSYNKLIWLCGNQTLNISQGNSGRPQVGCWHFIWINSIFQFHQIQLLFYSLLFY